MGIPAGEEEEVCPCSHYGDVVDCDEILIATLRANGKLLDVTDENAEVPPGVTHFLVNAPGQKPRLVHKRDS